MHRNSVPTLERIRTRKRRELAGGFQRECSRDAAEDAEILAARNAARSREWASTIVSSDRSDRFEPIKCAKRAAGCRREVLLKDLDPIGVSPKSGFR